MRHVVASLAVAVLLTACCTRHVVQNDCGYPQKSFSFAFHSPQVPGGGQAVLDELTKEQARLCGDAGRRQATCTADFNQYVQGLYCGDEAIPAFCRSRCTGTDRESCLDGAIRARINVDCWRQAYPGFMEVMGACNGGTLNEAGNLVFPAEPAPPRC